MVQERDRLVTKLADQEDGHKAALKAAQEREAALQAEFRDGGGRLGRSQADSGLRLWPD